MVPAGLDCSRSYRKGHDIETIDLHPTSRNRRIVALNRSNNIGTVIPSDMTTIRERVIPGSESRKPRGRV